MLHKAYLELAGSERIVNVEIWQKEILKILGSQEAKNRIAGSYG